MLRTGGRARLDAGFFALFFCSFLAKAATDFKQLFQV